MIAGGLKKGDSVEVWSNSKNAWIPDATVVEAVGKDCTMDGYTIVAGSVKVQSTAGAKWLKPGEVAANVRKMVEEAVVTKNFGYAATGSGNAATGSGYSAAGRAPAAEVIQPTIRSTPSLSRSRWDVHHVVRVPPDTKYTAEVVVLLTTLGAKRTEYNAGKRAKDLLEIKRVHAKIVDFNRDARTAADAGPQNQAVQTLMQEGKLQTSEDDDLILPQVFIDGLYIGDATNLQGLEDDGRLTKVLMRQTCVECGHQRDPAAALPLQCPGCWVSFKEILPNMMTIEEALRSIALMHDDDFSDFDDEYDEGEESELEGA